MKLMLVALLVLVQTPDIRTAYTCNGVADDKPYTMPLAIEKRGDNFMLTWGGGQQIGMGIRKDNQLSVAFVDQASGGIGVAAYKITDGVLDGTWAVGDGKLYPEKCVPPNSKEAK